MDLRPLGATGLRVSALGLGTVKLGRNRALKYPGGEGAPLPTDERATALLATAAELGVTLLDTAPAYGVAEERLGSLMAANRWFGGRDSWTLATKAGEEFDPATGLSTYDFSAETVRASVERSLRRLRTDRVEVALLHSDGRDEWILRESGGGGLDALRALRQEGKVRAIGISTKTVTGGLLAIELGCDVLMVTLNPVERGDLPVIERACEGGVGILIKKALGSGSVIGPETLAATLATPGVSCAVVGTSDPAHLRLNSAVADLVARQNRLSG